MKDIDTKSYEIWDQLAEKNPEYLLLIGDNVYADISSSNDTIKTDPEILWNRYIDVRLTLPLFYQQKLIPTHALWDDHDYGDDDGGTHYPHKEAAKEVFEAFYPQQLAEENIAQGLGVGSQLELGNFNFYFLDGRYFRTPPGEGAHLGQEQLNWLIDGMKEQKTPTFLIKGDQFFGGYHESESYEGNHPAEFNKFVEALKPITTPFIFLSGDRHLSEVMQFPRSLFGVPSFEITSSAIHSDHPEEAGTNPWRVVVEAKNNNFVLIQNRAVGDHWFMDVESIGINGERYFRRELAVYIKDLQNNLQEARKKRRQGRRRYRRIRR